MYKIAILTYDRAAFFELGCAIELFALPRPDYPDWYQCDVVTFEPLPCTLTGGVQITAKTISNLSRYHMLVVPSWPTSGASINPKLAKAIQKFHADGKRIITFCSGAFLPAELGILDGREATTHWQYGQIFKSRFPAVKYIENVLYVFDGHIGCSAGSAAALDLGIEIIRHDFGYKVANRVARQLVLSSHRKGGQAQFVETPVLHAPGRFSEALDWALCNLSAKINIDTLAAKANMSRRTFDRKFKTTFQQTPNEWLLEQRLQFAKNLLEDKRKNVEQVAHTSGFANANSMRHHFRKSLGISPKQYQEQFGNAGPQRM